jgi:uncharacterized iron-regulated protein
MNPKKIPIPSGVALALACAISASAQEPPAHPPLAPVCLAPAAWYTLDGATPRAMPGRELLGEIAKRDVVLLGERHDEADDHQWQIETLAALHLLRPKMVIGFEAFPRRAQPVLDKWIAGQLTVKQFLEQTEWDKVWNYPPEYYLPLFQFARINRIPMVALNAYRARRHRRRPTGIFCSRFSKRIRTSRARKPARRTKTARRSVFSPNRRRRGTARWAKRLRAASKPEPARSDRWWSASWASGMCAAAMACRTSCAT